MTDRLVIPAPLVIPGTPISPGLAHGIVYLQHPIHGAIDSSSRRQDHNSDEEISRLDEATDHICDDLVSLATRVEKEIDTRLAEVFSTHTMILNDPALREELRNEIIENLVSASSAVKRVFLRWENRFLVMESMIARDKAEDLRDISIRLRKALAGITVHPLEHFPKQGILVIPRLLPSDTMYLMHRSVAAVLLQQGSLGSHAALFTRQMGVPCLSDIADLMTRIQDGAPALVDANQGLVTLYPDKPMRTEFKRLVQEQALTLQKSLENAATHAMTRDGQIILVEANIGCREDALKAIVNGADGIGLFRLEQLYIGKTAPPSVDELVSDLQHALAPFKGKSVCIRLLDAGSDKPLPFIGFLAETNPALGRRGIRLMREYPELIQTQIQACLALRKDFAIKLLIPMVCLPEDVKFVRERLDAQCETLDIAAPPLGAMLETPAATLSARAFAPYVDFMSFGTNDLTQYAFAADRENTAVEPYFNDASDVIFRLIELVHHDVPAVPLSVCGELAGRTMHIERLLQCGIQSLSVAAPFVALVKAQIRDCVWHEGHLHQKNHHPS